MRTLVVSIIFIDSSEVYISFFFYYCEFFFNILQHTLLANNNYLTNYVLLITESEFLLLNISMENNPANMLSILLYTCKQLFTT
jgi:hypothetical protein